MLPRVLQPGGQVVESVSSSDVVNQECASSAAVVRPGNGPKCFLACCIPDLQFNLFSFDIDHTSTKLYSNGQIVYRLETLVGKL